MFFTEQSNNVFVYSAAFFILNSVTTDLLREQSAREDIWTITFIWYQ